MSQQRTPWTWAIVLLALLGLLLTAWSIYLPTIPSSVAQAPTPSPTGHREHYYGPPQGIVCLSNWSGNHIIDGAGMVFWTCTTEGKGTCLFNVTNDGISHQLACRVQESGGGEAMVEILSDGYGYWDFMTNNEIHQLRHLVTIPIPGWKRVGP